MNILEKIIAHKHKEVAQRKDLYPVKLLEKTIYFDTECISLKKYLQRADLSGVIAEFKRKSPSAGDINPYAKVEPTTIGYMQAGASALSVLTDSHFFGGKSEDLTVARKFNYCPILRKDFIIDNYQIIEAKSIGADAVLLIAATLEAKELKSLALFAKSLGLEVLMEVHNRAELDGCLNEHLDLVGVNNRDLGTFEVNLETSMILSDKIPGQFVKVAESGISKPADVKRLKAVGFEGFLIGGHFMSHSRPQDACARFIEQLK